MNYYKRHLGDYAKDTRHLSLAEHGAYCLLLDYYYATEKPIPDDRCERIANAYADSERVAVRSVLREFFVETADGWTNRKADEVIGEAQAKSLKAKESADARWKREQCERNANASKKECERNASHKPLATSHKEATPIVPKGNKAAAVKIEQVVEDYHAILPACQRIGVVTEARKRAFAKAEKNAKRVCRERGWDYGPDFWRDFFTECAKDEWLRGDRANPNNPAWRQSLDVLLRDEHFAKVMDAAIGGMA